MSEYERRTIDGAELRVSKPDDGPPRIAGYAARFNSLSGNLGGFVEKIAPGAFKRALAERQDVRALFNHDPNYVIGRTGANTLTLREDETGLWMEAQPPDTTWARDLLTSISRGDISQMSFAFSVAPNGDAVDPKAKPPVRTLLDVDLFDVSPVTYPAYEQTQVSVVPRSIVQAVEAAQAAQAGTSSEADAQERERLAIALRIAELEI